MGFQYVQEAKEVQYIKEIEIETQDRNQEADEKFRDKLQKKEKWETHH